MRASCSAGVARVNGRGDAAMNVPRKPLSNRRSRRRKSLPTSGWTVASSASILPAQSTASALGQLGRRAVAGHQARRDRRQHGVLLQGQQAQLAPRPRPSAVVRNANGSVPASTSSAAAEEAALEKLAPVDSEPSPTRS